MTTITTELKIDTDRPSEITPQMLAACIQALEIAPRDMLAWDEVRALVEAGRGVLGWLRVLSGNLALAGRPDSEAALNKRISDLEQALAPFEDTAE